jgi:hypothetical protein
VVAHAVPAHLDGRGREVDGCGARMIENGRCTLLPQAAGAAFENAISRPGNEGTQNQAPARVALASVQRMAGDPARPGVPSLAQLFVRLRSGIDRARGHVDAADRQSVALAPHRELKCALISLRA